MSAQQKLARLAALARMVGDHHLADLRRLANDKARSEACLAALAQTAPAGLGFVADAQASQRYQHWADTRRTEINLTLARQTAEWNLARDAATLAFGRQQVLDCLARSEKGS